MNANPLMGYGLVVGLAGTGDSSAQAQHVTAQLLATPEIQEGTR